MRKIILLICLMASPYLLKAQYTTPGTGKTYDMDSLVAYSGGVVTGSHSFYRIHADVKISAGDRFVSRNSMTVTLDTAVQVTFNGDVHISTQLDTEAGGIVTFTATDSAKSWKGLLFENTDSVFLYSMYITRGGGVRLLESDAYIQDCSFFENRRMGTTNTLNLFRSSPKIYNTIFGDNQGTAIGGGGNIANAPKIYGCTIYDNNTLNDNRPQISIGQTGNDTLVIEDCVISQRGDKSMAGAVSVFPIGGTVNVSIKNNYVLNNRYGFTFLGSNIKGMLDNNFIFYNNIQGDPLLGGSGINVNGDSTNAINIQNNVINGNLWGITIQGSNPLNTPRPNLGDSVSSLGNNYFGDNGHDGNIYAVYNNTAGTIMAKYNYWGSDNADTVENFIFHITDDNALGEVIYNPYIKLNVGVGMNQSKNSIAINVYPNPVKDVLFVDSRNTDSDKFDFQILGVDGRVLRTSNVLRHEGINVDELESGVYVILINDNNTIHTSRFIKQ